MKSTNPTAPPRLKDHPDFHQFMRFFDEMRLKGPINYAALHRSINALDPSIPYITVQKFFSKLGNPYEMAKIIARKDIREKMRAIADVGLDQVLKDPSLMTAKDRIALGKIAGQEDLAEIKILLDEKHKNRADNRADFLIDQARYGSVLDAQTADLLLPDVDGTTNEGS